MDLSGSLIIHQARLLDPVRHLDEVGDLWLESGLIRAIGSLPSEVPSAISRVDGRQWVIGPGLIDLYAHSGEPGFEQRETLASLDQAAQAGGFTQIGILPTTDPPLTTLDALKAFDSTPTTTRLCPLAAITLGSEGLTELSELALADIAGFMSPCSSRTFSHLHRALDYLQPCSTPILLWPWDDGQVQGGYLFEGPWTLRLGLQSMPVTTETAMVAMLLELIRHHSYRIHLMRITQPRSLQLIAQALQDGLPITASTTWMHLLLCDADIHRYQYDGSLNLVPPLPDASAQKALIQAIQTGILTAIATDHHPYTFEEKGVPFGDAPPGAIGLELALPLLWSSLVSTQQLSALQLWSALSSGPARCLHQDPPSLTAGSPANLTILDPFQTWMITPETLRSRSHATPWLGQTIQGKVVGSYCSR